MLDDEDTLGELDFRGALGNPYEFVSLPLFVTGVFRVNSSGLKISNTEKLILLLLDSYRVFHELKSHFVISK